MEDPEARGASLSPHPATAAQDPAPLPRGWPQRYEPVRPLEPAAWLRSILCLDRDGGGEVVVREIHPCARHASEPRRSALAALRREAEVFGALASRAGGSTFPRLIACELDTDEPWLALEYLRGASLRATFPPASGGGVRPPSGWSLVQALESILSLRDGLAALHSLGEAHGSLHPGALIVVEKERAEARSAPPRLRVRDLGWAGCPRGERRLIDSAWLPYVSPRLLSGSPEPTADADAWSLAAVLCELLTGKPPFACEDEGFEHERRFAIRRRMLQGPPPELPAGVPAPLESLLRGTLAGANGAADGAAQGGEPLAGFFAEIATSARLLREDPAWSHARLPAAKIELPAAKIEAVERRLAPPPAPAPAPAPTPSAPSPALLRRHAELRQQWSAAAGALREGFEALGDVAGAEPFSLWSTEVQEQAALSRSQEHEGDPGRGGDPILRERIREIEGRVSLLQGIGAAACRALKERAAGSGRLELGSEDTPAAFPHLAHQWQQAEAERSARATPVLEPEPELLEPPATVLPPQPEWEPGLDLPPEAVSMPEPQARREPDQAPQPRRRPPREIVPDPTSRAAARPSAQPAGARPRTALALPGRLGWAVAAVAGVALVGGLAALLWPARSPRTVVTEGPSDAGSGAPGTQTLDLTKAWVHGPGIADLNLRLEHRGRVWSASLPGWIEIPAGQEVDLRLSWRGGGEAAARLVPRSGADLQAKVDDLLRAVPPDAARLEEVDRAVREWVEEILEEEAR